MTIIACFEGKYAYSEFLCAPIKDSPLKMSNFRNTVFLIEETQTLDSEKQIKTPVLPFTSYVALRKLFHLSDPSNSSAIKGDENNILQDYQD